MDTETATWCTNGCVTTSEADAFNMGFHDGESAASGKPHPPTHVRADIADDLRGQLAVAKLAADSWKARAVKLDAANAEMLAALKNIVFRAREGVGMVGYSHVETCDRAIAKAEGLTDE